MIAIARPSKIQRPDPASQSTRTLDRRKSLLRLIKSLLSARQVQALRAQYAKGLESIVDLAQKTTCPPVLLYSVLTPLWSKTALKLRLLKVEKQVVLLRNKGYTDSQIAKQLQLPLKEISEHGDKRYSSEVCYARQWYHERAPKPYDPNDLEYDEATLPPTSRLGWTDGVLTDIPAHLKGWCPSCGHTVSIPCLACRVREDMRLMKINRAAEYISGLEEDEVKEPDLLFV